MFHEPDMLFLGSYLDTLFRVSQPVAEAANVGVGMMIVT